MPAPVRDVLPRLRRADAQRGNARGLESARADALKGTTDHAGMPRPAQPKLAGKRRPWRKHETQHGSIMDALKEVTRVLDEVLSLNGRAAQFTRETPLLGAIPELDSMAVVTLITTLEERFGISVDDDDIDGSTFASVGALADFVSARASV